MNYYFKKFYSPLGDGGNILVTGASGLVGSHLIKALLQQQKKVKALYRSNIPVFKGSEKIDWIKGDILDIISLEQAMENVQQVYHCAAIVSFHPSERALLNKTNIEGTANVVNECLNSGVEKLLHVSSVSAMGRIRKNQIITEQMKWTPETSNSEYGRSKFLAEMEVWRGIGEGLNAVIVNPTIILGAGDWNISSSALFKNVYKEFPWYTEGTTGFVDVDDVVHAMTMLMESDINSERFILSGTTTTYKHLFDIIAKAFGKKPPHKKVTPFIAATVWRIEKLKSFFTSKKPLITKETARTAQAKVEFDNSKLLNYLKGFEYQSLEKSVERICSEFEKKYSLI